MNLNNLVDIKNGYVQMAVDLVTAQAESIKDPRVSMLIMTVGYGLAMEYGKLEDTPEMDAIVLEGVKKKLGLCHEIAKGYNVMYGPTDDYRKIEIYTKLKDVVDAAIADTAPTKFIDI
jgi:hypothetical protein